MRSLQGSISKVTIALKIFSPAKRNGREGLLRMPTYSLSPAVIWVAESAPSAAVAAAASGQTQSVKAG